MRRQARLEKLLQEMPVVGDRLERGLDATKAAIREMWEPTAFFETLGVRYTGPFDGHDIAALEEALPQRLPDRRAPGRPRAHPEGPGLRAGRERPDQAPARHRRSPSPAATPPPSPRRSSRRPRQHPELVAITAAMPDSTGLLPFAERFPDRCFDVGIAEQHAVTVGRRHGHGRPAPGRRRLLDVPHPGLRPGQPRRRPAPPAGHLLPRPRRHHRRRRARRTTACSTWCCSPRCRA